MGTTVTPNWSLIKPDGDEKIQEDLPTFDGWATQNGENCDIIDGLFRKTEGTWTVTWTGNTSNPTIGAGGFTEGKYLWLGPRMLFGFFRLSTGGAGWLPGSGYYGINIPFPVAPQFDSVNDGMPIGKCYLHNANSSTDSTVLVVTYNPDTGGVYFSPPTGGTWTPSVPAAIEAGDTMAGYFMYPMS
jgi:hypothetical protein